MLVRRSSCGCRRMAGAPSAERRVLGSDFARGERPQLVVPLRCWQAAKSLGGWSLMGCTVAPPFDFASFELAPKGWEPGA